MNRWLVVLAGTLLQVCLGSVYAWSYFQKPLVENGGWRHTEVAWAFSLAIGCLGVAAAAGGMLLPKLGPRRLAMIGSLLYGAGYLLAAAALRVRSLPLLWLGHGVVGGIGLGLGYVTPIATVAKWFPDRKGLATGMVVMGFGFGALVMSKIIAPVLMARGTLSETFVGIGWMVGGIGLGASVFLRNPPDATVTVVERETAVSQLVSPQFLLLWLVFFCNITAGIAIIGFQSPLFQDLWNKTHPQTATATVAAHGATLIAVSSVFNGIGRLFWGGLSDRLGQRTTFRWLLGTQVVAFLVLMNTSNPWWFGALVCYVLLCYGGGFGVMPSFVLNEFGPRLMPVLYGAILTAWSAGGLLGPQVVAILKDHQGARAGAHAFALGAGLVAGGFLVSLLVRPRAKTPQRDGRNFLSPREQQRTVST